jgi:hypothetical protein
MMRKIGPCLGGGLRPRCMTTQPASNRTSDLAYYATLLIFTRCISTPLTIQQLLAQPGRCRDLQGLQRRPRR